MSEPNIVQVPQEQKFLIENSVISTTSISFAEEQSGQIFYRGINITDLIEHATFEETAYLLLFGKLPVKTQLDNLSWCLSNMTFAKEKVLRIIKELLNSTQPLTSGEPLLILQLGLATLACLEKSEEYHEMESDIEKIICIIAQTPIILAAVYRHYLNLPLLAPKANLSFIENFIYMLLGKIPSQQQLRYMEMALIMQMDNGCNASTFTARVVASTFTSFYSAISAAIGALSGQLHGKETELATETLNKANLGINPIFYPGVFAIARIVGWCAHMLELRKNHMDSRLKHGDDGKIYTPKIIYLGTLNLPYVPIEKR